MGQGQEVIRGKEKSTIDKIAQALKQIDDEVEKKNKDLPIDLKVEKDKFGKTVFSIEEKKTEEEELDTKILDYLKADKPEVRIKILKEIESLGGIVGQNYGSIEHRYPNLHFNKLMRE